MQPKSLLLLLLASLLVAPGAAAQGTGLSLSGPTEGKTLDPNASITQTYSVTLGCTEFLAAQSPAVDVTLTTDLPAYFGASSETVSFDAGPDCLNESLSVTKDVKLTLAPTSDAMSYTPATFTITAHAGDLTADLAHKAVQIGYVDGHTMTTSIGFPYNYTGGDSVTFDLSLDIAANGNTMVMFEDVGSTGGLNGIFHQTFNVVDNGERQRTLNVTWTPPTGAWTEDVISFYTYSHCLDGPVDACGPTNEQHVNWTIMNNAAGPKTDEHDEESPGLPVLGLSLALVAVAVALRRRS